jgi:plastocyanin
MFLPAAAQAATKVVYVGTPPKVGKALEKSGGEVYDFFPHGTTVRAGDSVRFVVTGFHTVDIPPKGQGAIPLIIPSGQAVSGYNDAAGKPFWFNGLPSPAFNPALFNFQFGKKLTANGKARIDSGLPVMNNPKPVTVKFAKAGSYKLLCDVHPGMVGTVKVVGAPGKAAAPKADAKALANQISRDTKLVKQLASTKAPANTVIMGPSGLFGTTLYTFAPSTLSVPTGTVVTFRNSAQSSEAHTATFGPGDPEKEPSSYLGKLAASFTSPAPDAAAVYVSEPPNSLGSYTSTLHGNGFWNSGILDSAAATQQVPNTMQVRFDQAGTFTYYCLIHPFMKATVAVTG